MQSFKSIPTLVLEIWGKKGSELGVFGIFSKSTTSIWFILLGNRDLIVLHVREKFQYHIFFCSRDMSSYLNLKLQKVQSAITSSVLVLQSSASAQSIGNFLQIPKMP